jgi:heme/copper-type cytochrome/quinol oxidase subunit 2
MGKDQLPLNFHAHCDKFLCAKKFSAMRIRVNGNAERNFRQCAKKSGGFNDKLKNKKRAENGERRVKKRSTLHSPRSIQKRLII